MTNKLVINSSFEEYKQAFLEENSKHNLISKNDEIAKRIDKKILESEYGIDLIDVPYLHWFKFNALFRSLEDTNKIMKIMSWRDMDLSKIKDSEQRQVYRKLKETFALTDKRTNEERSSDNDAALSEMFF
mgnify:CR=1 FL=1